MPIVNYNGKQFEIEKGTKIEDFINYNGIESTTPIVAAKINNSVRSLMHLIEDDVNFEIIDMSSSDGVSIYRKSLLFLFIKVVEELYPDSNVIVGHSINKGVFCKIENINVPINDDLRRKIESRMREVVGEKLPFVKRTISKEEAKKIYISQEQPDKIGVIDSREKDYVTIYSCGEWSDYFHGYLVPNTGYLNVFELRQYENGFILRYPERGKAYQIPPYNDNKKLFNVFREYKEWNRILGVSNIGELNRVIENNEISMYIRVSEACLEKKYAEAADMIKQGNKKVVLIAGPSSSGKTTSSYRLAVQLMVNGLKPVTIALDDYFVNRDRTPLDEDGKPDFESIEAIDLDLFNQHLEMLINGEEVEVPIFNFKTGMRELTGKKVKLGENGVLVLEGIHGLNERLTYKIAKEDKFKLYVSALTSLNIDDHNTIGTADTRLIRRIVRDNQYRGHDARRTIELWYSVRRGEDKNIFPYQEEADMMINTSMIYEVSALKPYIKPLLEQISPDCVEYAEAKRLLDFLQYFREIGIDDIPRNSILREFIGGSCF